jgi:hypothetical protein
LPEPGRDSQDSEAARELLGNPLVSGGPGGLAVPGRAQSPLRRRASPRAVDFAQRLSVLLLRVASKVDQLTRRVASSPRGRPRVYWKTIAAHAGSSRGSLGLAAEALRAWLPCPACWRRCQHQSRSEGRPIFALRGIGRPTDATQGRGGSRGATSAASLLCSTCRRLPRLLAQFARRSSRSSRLIGMVIKSVEKAPPSLAGRLSCRRSSSI